MDHQFFEKRCHYSIRKFAIGAASVMIGASIFGISAVQAEEVASSNAQTEETTVHQPQPLDKLPDDVAAAIAKADENGGREFVKPKAESTEDKVTKDTEPTKPVNEGNHELVNPKVETPNKVGEENEAEEKQKAEETNPKTVEDGPKSTATVETNVKEDAKKMDLLAENAQNGWRGASYNDAVVAFANGKALMMPQGSWALAAVKQQDPKFEIGMFAFPGDKAGHEATVGAGDLALSVSAKTKHPKETEKFIEYMTSAKAMQKYYDVDGSPVAVEGVKQDPKSPLANISQLAFTDKHYVWLGQHWNSEEDFFNLSASYLMDQNIDNMANNLNAFFNPMKADLD